MVALSSSTSTTSLTNSINSPTYLRLPSLEEIMEDAQSHFPRFLFDSEPLAVLELLNSLLIRCSDRGYSAVLECLWCWQDLSDFSHSLSPLAEELRCATDVQIVVASLRLLERLIKFSPDRMSLARLKNEIEELHIENIVIEARERFKSSSELAEPISDWMNSLKTQVVLNEKSEEDEEKHKSIDADSGTFSETEEIFGDKRKTQQQFGMEEEKYKTIENQNNEKEINEVQQLLADFTLTERNEILSLFKKLINEKLNNKSNNIVNDLNNLLNETCLKTSKQQQASSLHSTPPPPPPIHLKPKNNNSSIIKCLPPVPPPPPPPTLLLKNVSINASINLKNNQPTQASDIPRPLRPKALPGEGRRLRHLQWAKVPANAVVLNNVVVGSGNNETNSSSGHQNIWQGLEHADRELRDRLDFVGLDSLFGCPSSPPACINNNNDDNYNFMGSGFKRRRAASLMPNTQQVDFVSLLNVKKSLSVNVFLKLCRNSEQLLYDINNCNSEKIGADKLRTLMQLLPNEEEQQVLCQYNGNFTNLGQAERFLILLIKINKYKLRIDSMLFKLDIEELFLNVGENSGLETWLKGGEELMSSSSLHKILYILLHVGNYLNHGAGIGNAVGFRLSSLWKIEDVKAVGGGEKGRRCTLLHFVAKQTNNCAEELIKELGSVRESVKTSLEATKEDLKALIERHRKLEAELKEMKQNNANINDLFFEDFKAFLEKSGKFIKLAEDHLKKFEPLRIKLANFFCEPERSFSLEECFKIIASFIERFEKAVQENRKWSQSNEAEFSTDNSLKETKNANKIMSTNASLGVPSIAHRRRNSALPTFELKNKEDNDVSIGLLNVENNNVSDLPINKQISQNKNTDASNNSETITNASTNNNNNLQQSKHVEAKIKIINHPPSSPALFRLSRDAKQHLADSSNIDKKNGQVAKQIDHYEQHQGLQKQQRLSGICRLNNISKVRTGQMPAIIQTKGNIENNEAATNIQRTSSNFKRNQTLTPTSCKNLSLKTTSTGGINVEKQKETQQTINKKLHSSPLTRASSQQYQAASKRQQLQNTPKSNNSSPVSKSKPVLTRQVSTSSRPILIHSSGGASSNCSNNNSSSSEKKPIKKWI